MAIKSVQALANGSSLTSYTFSVTVPSSTGGVLVQTYTGYDAAASSRTASVTLNGNAMTELLDEGLNSAAHMALYRYDNPTAGAQNLVVTYSSAPNRCGVQVVYFDGTISVSNAANEYGLSFQDPTMEATTVTSATNDLALAFNWYDATSVSAGSGETIVSNIDMTASVFRYALLLSEAGASSVTFAPSWTGFNWSQWTVCSVTEASGYNPPLLPFVYTVFKGA